VDEQIAVEASVLGMTIKRARLDQALLRQKTVIGRLASIFSWHGDQPLGLSKVSRRIPSFSGSVDELVRLKARFEALARLARMDFNQ